MCLKMNSRSCGWQAVGIFGDRRWATRLPYRRPCSLPLYVPAGAVGQVSPARLLLQPAWTLGVSWGQPAHLGTELGQQTWRTPSQFRGSSPPWVPQGSACTSGSRLQGDSSHLATNGPGRAQAPAFHSCRPVPCITLVTEGEGGGWGGRRVPSASLALGGRPAAGTQAGLEVGAVTPAVLRSPC